MLNYFQNSFTVRLSSKFVIRSYFNIPPTLNMSLHYLVKYLCSKKCHAKEAIEANCHARVHTKTVLKYLPGKVSIL